MIPGIGSSVASYAAGPIPDLTYFVEPDVGTPLGNMTNGGAIATAFDRWYGTQTKVNTAGIRKTSPAAATFYHIGKDFGVGVAKRIRGAKIHPPSGSGIAAVAATLTFRLYVSNTAPANATDGTQIATSTLVVANVADANNTSPFYFGAASAGASGYRYAWVAVSSSSTSAHISASQVEFFEDIASNIDAGWTGFAVLPASVFKISNAILVPLDFDAANNHVHLYGAGGGAIVPTTSNKEGAPGGGGGGYCRKDNISRAGRASLTLTVGLGVSGGEGDNTLLFTASTKQAPSSTYPGASGGLDGNEHNGGNGGTGAGGDVAFTGGAGGSTTDDSDRGGSGGGGAAGPLGAGAAGGVCAYRGGGGGGAANGGSAGATAVSLTGGDGGAITGGTGGSGGTTVGAAGTNGGGGQGATTSVGGTGYFGGAGSYAPVHTGSNGVTYGPGSGSGGGSGAEGSGQNGNQLEGGAVVYGGGHGGGGGTGHASKTPARAGANGLIFIEYKRLAVTPATA